MNHILFRIGSYMRHYLRSIISKRGYGIHSPFAFNLVTNIINVDDPCYYYCFHKIEKLRSSISRKKKQIFRLNNRSTSLGRIAQTSASPTKDGQRLMRLAVHMRARKVIELGTSLGFGTAYLACSNSKASISTIDYEQEIQENAKKHIAKLEIENVTFINDRFSNALPKLLEEFQQVDLIFFDGDHRGKATEDYFNIALPYTHAHSVFIFHDIHWSKDMYKSWLKITQNPQVSISIECYNLGIVFFNPEHQKQHFYA